MQPYKQKYKPVLTDKPEVGWTNAALLVEAIAEIYTTPTPKGWHRAKKGKLYLIDQISLLQQPGSNIYTQNLSMNPS